MLSLEQIKTHFVSRNGEGNCLDGRDLHRLSDFLPPNEWPLIGLRLQDGVDPNSVTRRPYTEDAVREMLASDVAFGFEKALNRRGISSSLMFEVVKMWMWVLEDELQTFDEYKYYGLPLFKAAARSSGCLTRSARIPVARTSTSSKTMTLPITIETYNIEAAERQLCDSALTTHRSIGEAAKVLGISRHALKRRMIKFGIEWPKKSEESS